MEGLIELLALTSWSYEELTTIFVSALPRSKLQAREQEKPLQITDHYLPK